MHPHLNNMVSTCSILTLGHYVLLTYAVRAGRALQSPLALGSFGLSFHLKPGGYRVLRGEIWGLGETAFEALGINYW